MEISEFIKSTSRIEKYFNKEYTKAQIKEMYEELKKFEIERYNTLVSLSIRFCEHLPKVVDILQLDYNNPIIDFEKKERIKCNKCDSTGYIVYQKNIVDGNRTLKYDYVALCDCENGKNNYKKDYPIPYAKELGLI